MSGRLEGKRALVTGAGSGIGEAIARKFVAEGARVVLADVNEDAVTALAAELGERASALQLDVTDDAAVDGLADVLRERLGGLDVLANNAGTNGPPARSHEYPMDGFDMVWRVNVRGAFRIQQVGLTLMLESGGGSIVTTSSIGAERATPGASAYIISKGALRSMVQTAALEYAQENIRVNAIGPGITRTPWIDRLDPDLVAQLAAQVPQGRIGEPAEMANVAAFLASDEASHVSGQLWLIDGARSAG